MSLSKWEPDHLSMSMLLQGKRFWKQQLLIRPQRNFQMKNSNTIQVCLILIVSSAPSDYVSK